jgi:predicted RNA-binding protein
MCLSKAYIERDGGRELLMEEVASIDIQDDKLLLKTLFGEEKEVAANIKQIDFMARNILLQEHKAS